MIKKRMHLSGNFRLLEGNLKNFVTFTMEDVPDHVTDYRKHWNRLLTMLRYHFPDFAGVRIHELFPGKWGWCSHGLHTHVVCNDAMTEKKMRELSRNAGFGRLSFKEIEAGSEEQAAHYLSKYLGKKRAECLKGWQLVRSFGIIEAVRLIDIVKTSALTECWAAGAKNGFWKKMSFYEKSRWAIDRRFQMLIGKIPCDSFRSLDGIPLDAIPF